MLSPQDTKLLRRVGKGTLMGEFCRRFWTPFMLSEALPEPDCPPVRSRLDGEDLVAFRDSSGRVGVDREERRTTTFSAITLLPLTRSWQHPGRGRNAIYDWSHERLGMTDAAHHQMQRMLLKAARDLEVRAEPYAATHPELYYVWKRSTADGDAVAGPGRSDQS